MSLPQIPQPPEPTVADQILADRSRRRWERWQKQLEIEAEYDRVDLRRWIARQVINGADQNELCTKHGVDPAELIEHIEFMRPIVRQEHMRDAAIMVRQGATREDARKAHGLSDEELDEGLRLALCA